MYRTVMKNGSPVVLGSGSYGTVVIVKDRMGSMYARKICSQEFETDTVEEIEIMRKLVGCENVVQLVDTIPNHENHEEFDMIMELCEGSLHSLIGKTGGLEEIVVKDLARDVSAGLAFMRSKGISHCDLKPENILYKRAPNSASGYRFLLADFGMSYQGDDLPYYQRIQTSPYRCIENLLQETTIRSCDMPSLGCILYEAITGERLINCFDQDENEISELSQIRAQLNVIGLNKLDMYPRKLPRTVHDLISSERDQFSLRGTISRPDSALHQAFERLHYVKRDEIIDLIKGLLLPIPTMRIQADQVESHPAMVEEIVFYTAVTVPVVLPEVSVSEEKVTEEVAEEIEYFEEDEIKHKIKSRVKSINLGKKAKKIATRFNKKQILITAFLKQKLRY
jgi:serine/threonine protein kinase